MTYRALVFAAFALFGLLAASCGTLHPHFDDVVRVAASKHPRACTTPYTVTPLKEYSFRVDACEGTLFYRCWYQRKTMGRVQCCKPVADEAEATALFGTVSRDTQCLEFAD